MPRSMNDNQITRLWRAKHYSRSPAGPWMMVLGAALLGFVGFSATSRKATAQSAWAGATIRCASPRVIDGDTLRCGATRIRLSGIDAPELPGHCRRGRACAPGDPYASTDNLRRLTASGAIRCRQTDIDRYGRIVARCSAGNRDLSCEQVRGGYAIRRYAPLIC